MEKPWVRDADKPGEDGGYCKRLQMRCAPICTSIYGRNRCSLSFFTKMPRDSLLQHSSIRRLKCCQRPRNGSICSVWCLFAIVFRVNMIQNSFRGYPLLRISISFDLLLV